MVDPKTLTMKILLVILLRKSVKKSETQDARHVTGSC